MNRVIRAAAMLLAVVCFFPIAASAQNSYDIYVDSNGANNGCTITLPGGTFAGADARLQVTATSGAAPQVTGVTYATCAGGTFSAPIPVSGAYPVGLNNGIGGSDVIEAAASIQAVFQGASSARFGFAAVGPTGSDVLFTVNGAQGAPIGLSVLYSIPLFGLGGLLLLAALLLVAAKRAGRHRLTLRLIAVGLLLTSGIALAANFIVDGQVGDWTGVAAAANDPAGDASNGSANLDLRAAFIATENGSVFFRIDVADLQNQAPTATPQAVTTNEDTPVTITLASTDLENDPRTYSIVTQPTNGTLGAVTQVPPAGATVQYTPNANFNGTDTFTFRVTDSQGAVSTPATVTITVTPVDDAPVAVNDAATVAEDSAATAVPVLANDTDVDAGPISIASVTQPTNGVVVITGGGTGLTYAPNANYCDVPPAGPADTFTYTLNGGSTATVSMTVTCVDDAPVAVNDTAAVAEDSGASAIPVLANDTDIDAGPLTINAVTQPANGAVVITGGGTGLTYAPAANYCDVAPPGPADTFTYTLNGGSTATVSVTVTCVDDPPVAVADSATVVEDSAATAVPVLANDTDIDAGPISIASVTQPVNGTVVITGGGTGLTYAPALNYCDTPPPGPADTFTYTLNGGSTATVSMTVTCVDDAPVAVADSATVAEDAAATAVPVLANDTDVDAGPISIASVTQPVNGTVVITGGGTGLTYAPTANFCDVPPPGPADTFTYTLNGGSTATVSMTVTCVDDAPVAVNDAATVGEDSGATAVPVLANDTDIDGGPLTVNSVTQPANGTVVITGGGTGLTYAPAANYCDVPPPGPADTFTYTLNGGSTATVSMTVTCVDDAPVAVADAATVAEDSAATAVNVLANDTDVDGGPISIASVTQPGNGVVVITGGGTGVTYQPNANYCNTPPGTTPDIFTYTLNGGSTTSVSMAVTCIDDAPTAINDAATVAEDSGANAINVLANDTDIDGGPRSISAVTQPVNGIVVITGGGTGLTYAPNLNYCDVPPPGPADTFTYTLTPGGTTATVSITVTCVDDGPVAVNDAATVTQGTGANAIPVLANDTDVDGGPISIGSVTQPANGTVVITGGGTGLTYQPNAAYCNTPPGTTPDTFTYSLAPGGSTATVSVSVLCDVPPTAVADSATVVEDSGANAINVLANDTDPDGGPRSVATVTQPANGTVVITGGGTGLTYQPNANFCDVPPPGPADTFTYTLAPGGSTATVSVTVTCVDDAPVAVNDAATVAEDSGATAVTVLANDTDIDGGPISITAVTQPANGTVVITGGGTGLTFAPNANFNGTTTFTYTLNGGSSATVTMTVTPVNDTPVANAQSVTTNEDTPITITLTGSDVDVPTTLVFAIGTGPTQGTLGAITPVTATSATVVYTPNANANGADSFTFTASDGTATSTPATVSITITPVDDPPVAVNDAATVLEDSGTTPVNVLANDTDIDAGPKTVNSVTQPANGVVIITGGGTGLSYTPSANYCNNPPGAPLDTFTYTLNGGSIATVTMTVTCVNDAPTVTPPAATFAVLGNVRIQVPGTSPDGLLTTVADVDGPAPITVQNATYTSLQGGNVTVNQATGAWTYNPPAGYTGADSFTYNACDAFVPTPACSANATVNLTVGGMIWFVQTGAAACTLRVNGCGRLTNPYSTLAAFQAENNNGAGGLNPSDGDNVFLFENATSYVGPVILLTDQKLVGQDATATLQSITTVTVPTFSDALPAMNTGAPATTITSATNAIAIVNGVGNDNTIRGLTIGNVSASGTGINMDTGATTFGTLTIGALAANGGPDVGFTTDGRAMNLQGGTLTANLTGMTSTGGAQNIALTAVSGTSNFASGALSGAAGSAVLISGGNATVTYAGTISNAAAAATARVLDVQNHAAGTLTFSGNLTKTVGTNAIQYTSASGTYNHSGNLAFSGGLNVNTSSGTFSFSGGTKTLNTGAANAVALTNNNGATLNFTGGGLNIDTTGGTGFSATGAGPGAATGGTISVQGAGNVIDSVSGPGLNVVNTTIAAANLTFEHITSGNSTAAADPANGIVVNNTAALGSLILTGNGAAGSGGVIQFTSGAAISLTSTLSPQFTRMDIHDIGRSGVDGQQVTNFTLTNSVINNVGTAAAGQYEESNIAFNDDVAPFDSSSVSGTVTITGNTLTNARRHGIQIENWTGTLGNLTITGNTLTSSTVATTSLGSGVLVLTQGSATTTANLTTATISNNTITNFPSGEGILVGGGSGNGSNLASATLGATGTPITIANNAISATAPARMGSNAIRASFNGQFGVANFVIDANGTLAAPVTNIEGQGVSVFMGGTVTGTTSVTNNVIVANQTLAAGTQGMAVQVDDGPAGGGLSAADYNVIITGNRVSAYEGTGIRAIARASLGKLDVTIRNNIVGTPLLPNRHGIRIDSGSAAGDVTLCLAMTGNTSAGSGVNQGMGIRKQGTNAAVNDFGIVGLAPSPTTAANAAAKVTADNPLGNNTDVLSGDNFVNCTITP